MFLQNMSSDLVTKWITALRSKKYPQTHKALRNEAGFCCLGVLIDCAAPELWIKDRGDESEEWGVGRTAGDSDLLDSDLSFGILPASICDKFGLTYEETNTLMGLNDQDDANFDEIADYLENSILPDSYFTRTDNPHPLAS